MNSVGVFGLAFALSADVFAATVSKGLQCRCMPQWRRLVVAASFAAMGALAPLAGWFAGHEFGPMIAAWDHWVAFGILAVLGLLMIRQAAMTKPAPEAAAAPGALTIFALSLGTSVDAAGVGATLALLSDRILPMVTAIAAVTFMMAWAGLHVGRFAGARTGRLVETLGGCILIGLGLKVLYGHLAV